MDEQVSLYPSIVRQSEECFLSHFFPYFTQYIFSTMQMAFYGSEDGSCGIFLIIAGHTNKVFKKNGFLFV